LYFKFNISFLKIFNNTDIGNTTKKKIKPITIGEIIKPSKIPILTQNIFRGKRIFEFNRPSKRKTKEMKKNQKSNSLFLIKTNMKIRKKKNKKDNSKISICG